MACGFAAIDYHGTLLVDTVSPTERAAKVNWLVAHGGSFVSAAWDDERIDDEFYRQAGAKGLALVKPVSITPVQ